MHLLQRYKQMSLEIQSIETTYRVIVDSCRAKRNHLKYSQNDLAQRAGLSLRTIKKLESYDIINLQSLMKVYLALGELKLWKQLKIDILESPKEQFFRERNREK